ncbi:hypothetical protein OGAPHI_006328 [Ogataea philodendri]|uniref:Transcription factor domain-containing protein n=1 Tax=Ogataea philodendri TaxID=1378263 RepID=A0A9P8NYB7_9ASCO|nr:uncharacterized protein OGAPHI_006328 [Ogataea philodendri]KAH3661481.1 hypothetical protein OGAPHI_006328 [Ogataea philodendri]
MVEFSLLFGPDSGDQTRQFIREGLELFSEVSSFGAHEPFIDYLELSHNVSQFMETLVFPCRTLVQLYGVLISVARYHPKADEEIIAQMLRGFGRAGLFSEDSVELLQARLLLLEFYSYSMKIEAAWTLLFNIVCSAYGLGCHVVRPGKHCLHRLDIIWRTTAYYDCLIGSTIGRPNAISCTRVPARYILCELVEIFQDTNLAFQEFGKNETLYQDHILRLDSYITRVLDREEKDPTILYRNYRLLLLSNQIKLHYAFVRTHRFSQFQINNVLSRFFEELVEFIDSASKSAPRPFIKFRESFPFVSCYSFQTLAIVLACIKKNMHVLEPKVLEGLREFNERLKPYANFLATDHCLNETLDVVIDLIKSDGDLHPPTLPIESDLSYIRDDPFFYQMYYNHQQ